MHVPLDADVADLRFGPSQFVYDAGTLWLADRALRARDRLDLPSEIRPLVEDSYHPASRAALLPLGGPDLVAAERKRAGGPEARRTKAKQCCIPPTTAEPDGGAALEDDDDAVQAFTRDGVSATILPFSWDKDGARALYADASSPAWQLDAERTDAWRLAGELIDQTLSLPARSEVEGWVVGKDRAGWEEWLKRFKRFADESGVSKRVAPLPMKRETGTYEGVLRMDGKPRRVLYTPTLGFQMVGEKDEERAR